MTLTPLSSAQAPVIGPPTPLSARVRASNIVVPTHSGSAQVAGGHASHASISSTGSFRQHRASQQALTTSASARHLSVHGVRPRFDLTQAAVRRDNADRVASSTLIGSDVVGQDLSRTA
jgi:hypothetical protein